ncbi:MAG TPA: triple tyrosine motif-containing protein [Flavisolibacter sp.]|jgi:hypothetical protein|nr:triple tyrosine motif-containing protein [Flavisolibacter sp.]
MRVWWLSLFLLFGKLSFSQAGPQRLTGLPTNELNDLHIDQKGYLWIAHSLGISRFDGLSFTTYSHPLQVNLRTTDIREDSHGRIWFHNFSGQVFYIQNSQIQLLKEYDYKSENHNPKMVLCGKEILISSYKGLYVCNTEDLTTRFYPFDQVSPTALVSIAVVNNKAVVYNNINWYVYQQGSLVKTAAFLPVLPREDFIVLQPAAFKDTLYLTANPSGILYKLKLDGRNLELLSQTAYHDYINTVSVGRQAWVHTRNQSFNLQNGHVMSNADLTDLVTAKEGHTWYSSRRNGLLVSYRSSLWQQKQFPIKQEDYVRSLNANAGYFFAGTQEGTLYRFNSDSSGAVWKQELFNGLGSIDFIRYLNNDLFIVGSSTDAYIVNAAEKKIVATLAIKGILDVDFDGSSFYIASATGMYVVPYLRKATDKKAWLQQKKAQFPFFNWEAGNSNVYLLLPQRTAAIRFDSLHRQVYAATKNGLYEITKGGIHPYLINGKEVFATSLAFKQSKLYISTINDGLWIIEEQKAQHFSTANALASNMLIRIKLTEDHLWLLEQNGIQVLDIHSRRILPNLDLPNIPGANILDIAEMGNFGYLTTAESIYKVPLNISAATVRPTGYLDYVIINGRDTVRNNHPSLPHQQNDVQFSFSSPAFYNPGAVSFRYRLSGAEEDWRVTLPGERMIRYSSLAPGDYTFELYAVNSNGMQQKNIIRFPFTILKPWWQTAWFYLLANAVLVCIIYFIINTRIRQKLRLEWMRRSISHDLHDDIGATLSSVNFYIDLAQNDRYNTSYLDHIKKNINQAINNLDDLVWSINPRNDTTEQFINRMRDYAVPFLKAAAVQCSFQYDESLLQLRLDLQTKRHLFLLFKEMVNNVAKHARCSHCTIQLTHQKGQLCLSVVDDGQGFELAKAGQNRNGLHTMQERAQKIRGKIEITSDHQKGSRVAVRVPV